MLDNAAQKAGPSVILLGLLYLTINNKVIISVLYIFILGGVKTSEISPMFEKIAKNKKGNEYSLHKNILPLIYYTNLCLF